MMLEINAHAEIYELEEVLKKICEITKNHVNVVVRIDVS